MNALTQFTEQKRLELQTISESIPLVNNQKLEIDTVVKSVNQVSAQVDSTQKNYLDLYEQLKTQKEIQENDFKLLKAKLSKENSELLKVIENHYCPVKV